MIIWTGWGVLVFVITLLALVVAQALTNAVLGPGTYEGAAWPKLVATLVSAIGIWLVGTRLNAPPPRTLRDEQTGERVSLRRRHTFFFIPMQYWGPIVVIVGVFFSLAR